MKVFITFFILFTIVKNFFSDNLTHYNGYNVFEVYMDSREKAANFIDFWDNVKGIDFWQRKIINGELLVMVSEKIEKRFIEYLNERNLPHIIRIFDVENTFFKERQGIQSKKYELQNNSKTVSWDGFNHYWTYENVEAYYQEIAKTFPKFVKIVEIGMTFELRPIKAVIVSRYVKDIGQNPIIFVVSLLNPREWTTLATSLHIINRIIEIFDEITRRYELNEIDWIFIPVANPDGFVYTLEKVLVY